MAHGHGEMHGRLYNLLFQSRNEADYVDFVRFEKEAVAPWLPEVEAFVNSITLLLQDQED